jgi:hypothetical protein
MKNKNDNFFCNIIIGFSFVPQALALVSAIFQVIQASLLSMEGHNPATIDLQYLILTRPIIMHMI